MVDDGKVGRESCMCSNVRAGVQQYTTTMQFDSMCRAFVRLHLALAPIPPFPPHSLSLPILSLYICHPGTSNPPEANLCSLMFALNGTEDMRHTQNPSSQMSHNTHTHTHNRCCYFFYPFYSSSMYACPRNPFVLSVRSSWFIVCCVLYK